MGKLRFWFRVQAAVFALYGAMSGQAFSAWSDRVHTQAQAEVLLSLSLASLTEYRI